MFICMYDILITLSALKFSIFVFYGFTEIIPSVHFDRKLFYIEMLILLICSTARLCGPVASYG